MRIKLTKISGSPDSPIQPGYWVKGETHPDFVQPHLHVGVYLFAPISTSLNEHFSWFETTKVLSITDQWYGWTIVTKNSVWRIEKL